MELVLNSPPAVAREASRAPAVGVFELYRQVWHYAAGARGFLLLSSSLLIASQLVKLLLPWLAAQAIDTVQGGFDEAGAGLTAASWVAAIIAVFAVSWALHGPGRVIERTVALRVRQALIDRLYERLARAPLAWRERHHAADLQHRMVQSSGALFDFTQNQFVYLQNAVNLLGPLIALALMSTLSGAIALFGFGAVALTVAAFDRSLMRLARQETAAERRYGSALLDCLSNVATVTSLRLHASTRRLLGKRLDAVAAPLGRSIVLNEWKWCAVDMASVTLVWTLVAAYAWQASASAADGLLLGSVFMVYQYAQQAGGVAGSLASNLQNFLRVRTDLASADTIWSAPQRDEARGSVAGEWRSIDMRGLRFEHDTDHAAANDEPRGGLHDVSLVLRRGERVALVGPSGSGKSTLLRVLAGLYEPQLGTVEIDGVASAGLRDLAGRATLIPQEAQIFEASVRDNLAFDLPHPAASIEAALRIGSFDGVLASLPQGLDTPLAQGGANLSGGQRQRLCLARGALAAQGSSLLLLDEPTSALDPLSEALVQRRFGEAFADACIVASVHRMALLAHFDRVVLMEDGRVLDSGSVDELLARQPLFRRMAESATEKAAPSEASSPRGRGQVEAALAA